MGRSLAPFTSRTVLAMAISWLLINAVMAFVGLGAVTGDAPIAWEAHLVGYAVGLLAIGPHRAGARPPIGAERRCLGAALARPSWARLLS